MAIALEADFTLPKASRGADPSDRKAEKPGPGETFADSLSRVREAQGAESDAATAPLGNAPQSEMPLPSIAPEISLPDGGLPAEGSAELPTNADIIADTLKSEIVVDREIKAAELEAQADPSSLAFAATLAVSPPEYIESAAQDATLQSDPGNANMVATANLATVAPIAGNQAEAPVPVSATAAPQAIAPASLSAEAAAGAAIPAQASVAATASTNAPPTTQVRAAETKADPDALANTVQAADTARELASDAGAQTIAPLTDASGAANADTGTGGTATSVASILGQASLAAPQVTALPPAPTLLSTAPAQAVITASPAQIVDIVSDAADDGQSDRIVVQLDPPELGRVSIDFKFDANGLQHVVITSETPEAMRQLRQMHFELVQSLERHGIGSENMSFQHQHQSAPQTQTPNPFARTAQITEDNAAVLTATTQVPGARTLPGGRLDIRL